MADVNVKNAQIYLNAMFGGHPSWVHIDEDGNTGTLTMQGIIRAFQIHNNTNGVTGGIGPSTIEKMKGLAIIDKMDPNAPSDINVCLIQCALFCKGYNAGGITGIYYTSGVAAVKEMQSDAGLPVTGKIDWKVWAGLLSLNWFKKVSGGDNNTRLIQQQLNRDWSDIVGVGPCDGIVSRQTALSLIGALQGAEKVTTELIIDLNQVNFGDATTSHFPSSLKKDQNSAYYIPFNKLAQYGLYFNGYNPGRFDGIFDFSTELQVQMFQGFYALTDTGLITLGEVNVTTMKSLLTSKGDINRPAKACDTANVLNAQQARDLKSAGYTHVGRYLTGSVGDEFIPKYLTLAEIKNIQNAGLCVFPIYQDGGYYLDYFKNSTQGTNDAQIAISAAQRIGVPANTTIYFAVDFDCYGEQIDSLIIPYFRRIKTVFNSQKNPKNYRIGIYAPRYVCTKVSEAGLATTSFVADMSTGFSCNLGFPIPSNWAFDQFFELKPFTSSPSFDLDKVAYSARDTGIQTFDKVDEMTPEEIEQEQLAVQMDTIRFNFYNDVLEPLGFASKLVEIKWKEEETIHLGTYYAGTMALDISATLNAILTNPSDANYTFEIETDSNGNLTAPLLEKINEIMETISESDPAKSFESMLKYICLSVKDGSISFKATFVSLQSAKFTLSVSQERVLSNGEKISSSISLEFLITLSNYGDRFLESEVVRSTVLAAAIIGVIVVGWSSPSLIPEVITFFSTGAGSTLIVPA